eukprot:gene3953-15285_t
MENDGEAKNEPSGTFRRQLARPELGSVEVRCLCNKLLPSPFPQPESSTSVDFQSSGEEAAEPEEDGKQQNDFIQPSVMFLFSVSWIQIELSGLVMDQIYREVKECKFIIIQVDKTTDISTKEQVSAIIGLDKKGDIVEGFSIFYNVSSDRTAPTITAIIKDIFKKYGSSIQKKLIMQTYDGASVMSGHIAGVQTLVTEQYPYAFFFHCAAHRLNLVLCQSASAIPAVNTFFALYEMMKNTTVSMPPLLKKLVNHLQAASKATGKKANPNGGQKMLNSGARTLEIPHCKEKNWMQFWKRRNYNASQLEKKPTRMVARRC